jgi:hypothetical protein
VFGNSVTAFCSVKRPALQAKLLSFVFEELLIGGLLVVKWQHWKIPGGTGG